MSRLVSLFVVVLLAAAVSCGGGDKKLELGGTCSLNSDCADPLVCKFGACHKACVKSADCVAGERCVQVDGVAVCQMIAEASCKTGGNCPVPLTCRVVDNTCRNQCVGTDSCLPGQTCSGTVCIETKELTPVSGLDGGEGTDGGPASGEWDGGVATDVADAPQPARDAAAASSEAGSCTLDACPVAQTIASDIDFSKSSITPGRTCTSEAPAFSVALLSASQATLTTAPEADCLSLGDEVLLINLQGATGATANVGNWELLTVRSVQGATVTFGTAKTRNYGSGANNDASIGIGANDQKVAIIRVPQFNSLTVKRGATLEMAGWDGAKGGVLALHVGKLQVEGTISAEGLGYRSGRWSQDDKSCSDNVTTESGESIDGPPVVGTASHMGAPGGISAAANVSFNTNTPINSGAGHARAGEPGKNGNGRIVGSPGTIYGANDASRLTMGSGASGGLTCDPTLPGPALNDPGKGSAAGGIIVLVVDQVDVAPTGIITSSAKPLARDASASGGYVFVQGRILNLGVDRVTAKGGVGKSLNGPATGQTVASSDGYVVLKGTTITGTSVPPATQL